MIKIYFIEKKYLQLNDIECYKKSFHLSNEIWEMVINWNHFSQDTVGKQFVRATDSISANISEGFGRFSKKEKIQFYRYAKGSVKECLDWNQKAKVSQLILQEEYDKIFIQLKDLPKSINTLILFTNTKLKI